MKNKQRLRTHKEAQEAIDFSVASYSDSFIIPEIKSQSSGSDFWIWHFDECVKTLFIGIRGSNDLSDFLRNASIFPTRLEGVGLCHSGFYRGARVLEFQLLQYVNHAKANNYRVIISGHSYGGAVALILQEIYRVRHDLNVEVVTFGSPRVWLPYANPKGKHLRVEIEGDPVTMMPIILGSFFRIYRHKQTDLLEIPTDDFFDLSNHSIQAYKRMVGKLDAKS